MRLAILLLVVSTLYAQPHDRLYRPSVAVAIGAQGADIASSWGGIEANPMLGRGQRFGWRMATVKAGVVGAGLLVQWIAVRRYPRHKRVAAIVNFGFAGATTVVATRNWSLR